jgi:hypothetical protein
VEPTPHPPEQPAELVRLHEAVEEFRASLVACDEAGYRNEAMAALFALVDPGAAALLRPLVESQL